MSPSTRIPRPHLTAALLALALTGCGLAPLDAARLSLGASTVAYNATNAAATQAKAAERDACLTPPAPPADAPTCVEGVIVRWRPRSAAVQALHAALLSAGAVLALVEALGSRGPVPATWMARLDAAVAAVLEAATAAVGPGVVKGPDGATVER